MYTIDSIIKFNIDYCGNLKYPFHCTIGNKNLRSNAHSGKYINQLWCLDLTPLYPNSITIMNVCVSVFESVIA